MKTQHNNHDNNDLLSVGPNKPLGYLPISFLEQYGWNVSNIVTILKKRGIVTLVLEPQQCMIASGAVYAYHRESLEKELIRHTDVLKKYGWPLHPDAFVLYHIIVHAAPGTDLFDVIADAYGDCLNTLRKSNGRVCGQDGMPDKHFFGHFNIPY